MSTTAVRGVRIVLLILLDVKTMKCLKFQPYLALLNVALRMPEVAVST